MSKRQILIIATLAIIMTAVAMLMGNWSEQINPDGIASHPATDGDVGTLDNTPRDAYSFGLSIGLLATALAYCCAAFGLMINAKSKGRSVSRFTYWVAGLAALGFSLSYIVDDYFY